jgi:two-component system LytT family response regulator
LEIIGQYASPIEATTAVELLKPDLVFLDIAMPRITGFEFLEQFNPVPFRVIFTTAYDNHAIRAFQVNAIHYLLKPIDKEELVIAVQKALQVDELSRKRQMEVLLQLGTKKIALPSPKGLTFTPVTDILYCVADANICEVYRHNQPKLFVTKLLKELEDALPEELLFFRVHNKYLINLRHVTEYLQGDGGDVVMSNGDKLPVARTRKKHLLELLGSV